MRSLPWVQVAACCAWLFLSGCSSCRGRDEARGEAAATVADRAAVLAELPGEAEARADAGGSGPPAPAAGAEFVFAERGGGVAYLAGDAGRFRVVHNGRAGAPYAAIGQIVLSPDGRRCAYPAQEGATWRLVVDGKEGAPYAEVVSPAFSADGAHVAHQARSGEAWHLVVDGTASAGTARRIAAHAFGGDSSRLVFVEDADEEGFGRLVVSDLAFARRVVVDGRASSLYLNADGSRAVAVAAVAGGQQVLTFALDRPDQVARGPEFDAVHNVVFGPDGASLAYLAERGGDFVVTLDDRQAPLPPGDDMISLPVIHPDRRGFAALVISNGAVTLRQFFVDGAPEATYEGAEGLVYSADGRSHAYAAHRGERWFVVANGKEGPTFDRVVNPAFSPDGKRLVYRARKDGKRFVVVADADGGGVRALSAYEQVFPVRFTADGKSIAYGVKDGRRLAWRVDPL